MTVSSLPGSPPAKRLWWVTIVLTCCLTVYLVIVPLLHRKAVTGWPLVLAAVLAAVAAASVLVSIWVLRQRQAAALNSLARFNKQAEQRLGERADQLNAEFRQREQQLLRQSAELHDRVAGDSRAVRQVLEHLVTVRLPAALDGAGAAAARADGLDEKLAELLERVVALAAGAGDKQESMRTAVVALSRRVQTSAHRIQEEATVMADRHPGDADVLNVSMRVDHAAAQQARHAQSMAVLCGEWPGQQWLEPLPLVDVVRAAAGRIIAFQRIEVAGDPDIAVTAPVVEPLIHLVAELLANATQSAPPTTMVPVTIRSVQRGAVIEIHDCGVGLDEHRLEQAREVASGRRLVGLDGLGEFPQTGLAVVGQYVQRHGLRVDVSESVYGGVHVVVGVPADVVEIVEPAEATGSAAPWPVQPDAAATADSGVVSLASTAEAANDDGLPRRRSRRHALAATPPAAPANAAPALAGQPQPERQTPEEAGAWMGAFLSPDPAAGSGDEALSPADVSDSRSDGQEQR